MSGAAVPNTRTMPLTLREFSQWLDWVKAGKPAVGTFQGPDVPAGELYQALTAEALAKAVLPALEVDKTRALTWMERYAAVGVSHDPKVTNEYRFVETPGRVVAQKRKINGDRLKSRYPQVYAQCRVWTPYRLVKLSPDLAPPRVDEPEGGFLPYSEDTTQLPKSTSQWPVTWGLAFHRYRERLEQMKPHKKVIEDAVEVMSRYLTDEAIKAEYAQHWDGHGSLLFTDGSRIQLDRLQFSQDAAAEVLLNAPEVDLDSVMEVVEEHTTAPTRRLAKIELASNDPQRAKGLGNPFEGD